MPPRTVTLVIVAFWLGMTAWLVQRDLWPRLAPGQPPDFALDIMDDSQPIPLPVRWTATHTAGGKDPKTTIFVASSTVVYRDRERLFELTARLDARRNETPEPEVLPQVLPLARIETVYTIEPEGQVRGRLVGLKAALTYGPGGSEREGLVVAFHGKMDGDVCRLWREGRATQAVSLDVSRSGAVLLPLHPLNRIRGLSPGRRWGLHLLDPTDALLPGEPRVHWVNAVVRDETETLEYNRREHVCRVIDYADDRGEVSGSTWVSTTDDRVLRMTVRLGDGKWDIVREGP